MRLGIDMGGTKTEIVALGQGGEERLRRRVATPRDDYATTIRTIADLVRDVESGLNAIGSVGVCIPGTVSPATGLVKNANTEWVNGRPLDRDLTDALGRPVRVANDGNCLALSEAVDGAAAGAEVVFAAVLGTGCGGGIAIGGRPLIGRNAVAGEWGHTPLPWPQGDEVDAPPCFCGQHGCLETWISGTGLARDFAAVTGKPASAPDIVERAAAGGAAAAAALDRLYDRLGRALTVVVDILDPNVIVLGGGLSNHAPLYTRVPEIIAGRVLGGEFDTPVRQAVHGDSSGVRGAAWLWAEGEEVHDR